MKNLLDSIYYNAGNFIYLGAQMIISIILVHLGGFEDAGYFSLAMTISNIFIVVGNYGIRIYQVSDVNSQYSDNVYVLSRILTVIVSMIICIGYSLLMDYSIGLIAVILIYAVYKCIETYSDVLSGIWQKNGNMKDVGLSLGLKGILNIIAFSSVFFLTRNLFVSVVVMALSSALVLVTFDVRKTELYVKEKLFREEKQLSKVWLLLGASVLSMASSTLVAVFNGVPKIMVEKILDAEALGVFSSVSVPTVVISTFAGGVLLPIAPKMAENYENGNKKNLIRLMLVSDFIMVFIGLLASVGALLIGEEVLTFIFGYEILPYYNLFYYMIWVNVLLAMINCYTTLFISVRQLKSPLIHSGFACILLILLCSYYIRENGIFGAGCAMLFALVVQFVFETVHISIIILKRKRCS